MKEGIVGYIHVGENVGEKISHQHGRNVGDTKRTLVIQIGTLVGKFPTNIPFKLVYSKTRVRTKTPVIFYQNTRWYPEPPFYEKNKFPFYMTKTPVKNYQNTHLPKPAFVGYLVYFDIL